MMTPAFYQLRRVPRGSGDLIRGQSWLGSGNVTYERISIDRQVMGGVPCIRGTRVPAASVVGMVAEGMSVEEIMAGFLQLAGPDVREALRQGSREVTRSASTAEPSMRRHGFTPRAISSTAHQPSASLATVRKAVPSPPLGSNRIWSRPRRGTM